jgi:hypothetical protein
MPVPFYCPRPGKRPAVLRFRYTSHHPGAPRATGSVKEEMVSLETTVRYSGDVAIIDLAGRIVLNDGSAIMREAIAKLREGGANKSF